MKSYTDINKNMSAYHEILFFASNHPGTVSAWVSSTHSRSISAYRQIKEAYAGIIKQANDAEMTLKLHNKSIIMFTSNPENLRGVDNLKTFSLEVDGGEQQRI